MRRLALLIAIVPMISAAPAEPSKSALETDPSGWTDLLAKAGKELMGWKRGPIPPTGMLNPQNQWSIDEVTGNLVCEGDKGHEWLRYDREVGDGAFHVEWRFTPVSAGKANYNSGLYARNSVDATIWHQAQTGSGSGGFLFGASPSGGTMKSFNLSKQVTDNRVKPAGEWNTFEITCKGKEMSLWVNGAVTCRWGDCEVPRGYLGLEAEGYRIEFRKVMLKAD